MSQRLSTAGGPLQVVVWDAFVRIAHWTLATTVIAAWLTRTGWGATHEWIGYAAAAIVTLRVAWGFAGAGHARFKDFVVSPRVTLRYATRFVRAREARYLGHNPLGGWMIVVLLTFIALVAFTGFLYTTDRYWGIEWVESLHSMLADLLMVLVLVHVAGVAHASWRHRENLLAAMLHGRKRAEEATSVRSDPPSRS